ncbi:DUF551 domain-containing protein [Enterobacter cloacae]
MSTITREFTKEQLIAQARKNIEVLRGAVERIPGASDAAVIHLRLAEITLASLEAEAVYQVLTGDSWVDLSKGAMDSQKRVGAIVRSVYTAPPAPVSVPDELYQQLSELYHAQEKRLFKLAQRINGPSFDKYAHSPSQAIDALESAIFGEREDDCRAAMLQSFGNSEQLSSTAILDGSEDTKRLNWLDDQNKRLNEYYGTTYGWRFDANFQRNAMMLNDSNYPVMTVRQAIDEAIAAAPQQEVK